MLAGGHPIAILVAAIASRSHPQSCISSRLVAGYAQMKVKEPIEDDEFLGDSTRYSTNGKKNPVGYGSNESGSMACVDSMGLIAAGL